MEDPPTIDGPSDRAPATGPDARRFVVPTSATGTVYPVHLDLIGLAVGASIGLTAIAAVVDARTRTIPDRWILAALMPLLPALAFGGPRLVVPVVLGATAAAAPVLGVHLLRPADLGFGDVKLAAVIGGTLGLVDWRAGLVAVCVAAGATAAVGLVGRRRTLPLGPGLVAGAVLALPVAGGLWM